MYRVSEVLPPARLTLLKKLIKITKLYGYIPLIQDFKCVQSIFRYHLIQSHKIKKIDFEQKNIFFRTRS
jgi:uncharacterized protein YqhQ